MLKPIDSYEEYEEIFLDKNDKTLKVLIIYVECKEDEVEFNQFEKAVLQGVETYEEYFNFYVIHGDENHEVLANFIYNQKDDPVILTVSPCIFIYHKGECVSDTSGYITSEQFEDFLKGSLGEFL